MQRQFEQLAPEVAGGGLRHAVRCCDVVLLHLAQACQRLLQVVVGVVLSPRRELFKRTVGRLGRLRQCLIEPLDRLGERLTRILALRGSIEHRAAGHGAHDLPHALGIDPSLLQRLRGHFSHALTDRLIVLRRGRPCVFSWCYRFCHGAVLLSCVCQRMNPAPTSDLPQL
jgi:hypothetical protein